MKLHRSLVGMVLAGAAAQPLRAQADPDPGQPRPPMLLEASRTERLEAAVRMYLAELIGAIQRADTATLAALVPDDVVPEVEKPVGSRAGCASVGAATIPFLASIALSCTDPGSGDQSPMIEVIALGFSHACALDDKGGAWCWGQNDFGQLGNGTTEGSRVPVRVMGNIAFSHLAAGGQVTCALSESGAVYCWGMDLADTAARAITEPTLVDQQSWTSITVGFAHVCGIRTAGQAYCWGSNSYGQLGTGDTTNTPTPKAVAFSQSFTALSAGTFHTCGVTVGRRIYCWGQNGSSRLGVDTVVEQVPMPVAVAADTAFASVSAGGAHTCALSVDGRAWCWGANESGQLGVTGLTVATRPVEVQGVQALTHLEAGEFFTCALDTEGLLFCWGENFFGQRGDGTRTSTSTPVVAASGRTYGTFDVAFSASCGIARGQALCWGANNSGQLGDGTNMSSQVPVTVRF